MNTRRTAISLAVAAAIGTSSSLVYADVLEEIVTTATRREESVQDVPISVSALSGDQIEALGLSDLTEITQQIPGMQAVSWSPQLTIFNLRGISQNNFVDNLEAPIAVYQDDVYLASMNVISGQMFDLERVEVLRGPQGTLFGRNATGGLIHYISRGADDDVTNGYARVNAGSFDRFSFEGAVGGSISDTVRFRVAGRWEEADGYIDADTSIPPVDPRSLGGADGYALRGTLQVDFSDTLSGDFIAKFASDNDVPTGGYVFENCQFDASSFCPVDIHGRAITEPGVVSGDPHLHQNDTQGSLDRDTFSLTARFTKDFDNGNQFVAITNYLDVDKSYIEDGDAFPAPIVVFGQDGQIDQFSQELRLSGANDTVQWQFGAFFMDFGFDGPSFTQGAPTIDLSFDLFNAGLIPAPTVFDANPFDGRSDLTRDIEVTNVSVFGQGDFFLSDTLTLTAGLRWSSDNKKMNFGGTFTSDDQPTPLPYVATESNPFFGQATILNAFTDDEIDYDDIAARLSLQKDFSDTTMGFVSWNRGIKGGNWTLSAGVDPTRFTHEEEVLNAYEVGIKTDIGDTARLNATLFYYDYEDYQTFVAIPPGATSPNPQIGNSDATASGGEVELFLTPTEELDMLFGLAFMDSEVDIVESGTTPLLNAEFPGAPSLSFNYLFRYARPMSNGELAFQFDGAWYDDQFLEVTNGPGTVQEAYNISNLSVSWISDQYTVTLWSKNVFDEIYKAYSLDLGLLGATTYYAPPQTSGITFEVSF